MLQDITMYETLVRQHDLAVYQMPTLDDAISKLKDIESRKKQRKVYQHQRAVEEKQKQEESEKQEENKRKAGELDDGNEGVDENAQSSDKKIKLDASAETATRVETVRADVTMDPTDETPTMTRETSAEAQQQNKPTQTKSKVDWRTSSSVEEKRYLSTKPAPQGRGHTSYLTFAFLMPEVTSEVTSS